MQKRAAFHLLGPDAKSLPVHDARLVEVASDLLARTLVLTFSIDFLQRWLRAPEGLRFVFRFEGVRSVTVAEPSRWPGPAPDFRSRPDHEAGLKLWQEYLAKGRYTSLDWSTFEETLAHGDHLDVLDGDMASVDGAIVVHVSGHLPRDRWRRLWIRAERLLVQRSDGEPFDLDALDAANEGYWDDWDRRRPT